MRTVIRTFIVEDNPVILVNLQDTLEELSNVRIVGTAADEQTAIERMRKYVDNIDLMIVDLFLAAGSGLTVLRVAQESNVPARRVVLTNYATPDIRERCAALGAERVFDKSSEIDDLIDYCSTMSRRSSADPEALR